VFCQNAAMHPSPVHDKTIVVTGASTGIGEGLAVALAARGGKLVLAARNAEELARVQRRCEDAGGAPSRYRPT
jgi:short-subunit dehydrogenase